MSTSQQFIPIGDVNDDLVFLKDGGVGLILSVSAVNFALLFETEQISIINSFAGMINSLSFPIQIVIYSKVMDVSSYLHTIDKAMAKQANPLLQKMTLNYREFVEKSIKENNVLDKQFYICIKITSLEIGLLPSKLEDKIRKVTTMLEPRKDHLVRQLGRLGLKAKQLTTPEVVKLFFEIYNPPTTENKVVTQPIPAPILKQPEIKPISTPAPPVVSDALPPRLRPIRPTLSQASISIPTPISVPAPVQANLGSPFVVEELPE